MKMIIRFLFTWDDINIFPSQKDISYFFIKEFSISESLVVDYDQERNKTNISVETDKIVDFRKVIKLWEDYSSKHDSLTTINLEYHNGHNSVVLGFPQMGESRYQLKLIKRGNIIVDVIYPLDDMIKMKVMDMLYPI